MVNQKCLRGSIFLVVLIFCLIAAIITIWLMEASILQVKMLNAFEQNLVATKTLDAQLNEIEHALENGLKNSNHVALLQFIPDTLALDDYRGTNYYEVKIEDGLNKIISTLALRNKSLAVDDPLTQVDWLLNTLPVSTILHKKAFLKLKNGKKVLVVAHTSDENPSILFISFLEFSTGQLLKRFELPLVNTIITLSEFFVVDLEQKGHTQSIYIGDSSGTLWKIKLNYNYNVTSRWKLQQFSIDKTSSIKNIVVGHHPTEQGVLLYLLLTKEGRQTIQTFWDSGLTLQSFFKIDESAILSEPLLRLGYLVFLCGNKVKLHDAFSGKFVREQKINLFYSNNNDLTWQAPVVLEESIAGKRQIIIKQGNSVLSCQMDVDGDRLGRRTWQISQKT